MGARSGNNYLSAMRKLKSEIWIGGERVADPTTHPALKPVMRSLASLYDMQIEHPEAMTYRAEGGERAGLSFIQPQSADDVRKRGAMMRRWAEFSGGMLGRTPDYLNASIAAMAAAHEFFASTVLKADPSQKPFALAFAVQCNAPGLKFLCRDAFDSERSHFDHPLASRFEEMDCVVIFENVMVPWERVFVCGDMARCNALYAETGAVVNMMHQVVVKNAVKSEFMLGLAARIAEVSDAMSLPHVRERLAEMIITTELMRSCLRAAEADAAPDKWGEYMPARPPLDTARNLFPKLYPRLVEIIQLNSSSSLMATPSERDFKSQIAPEIERYFGQADAGARERVALYRLAWDAAGSSFAGRQVLYERFFFGDPVRMASALVDNTDLAPLVQRVKDFMARTD